MYRGRRSCEKDNSLESYHALNYAYTDLKHRYNDLLHKYNTSQRRSSTSTAGTSPSQRSSGSSSRRGSMGDEFLHRGTRGDLYSPWPTHTNLSPRNSSDGHLRRHSPLSHAVDMDAAGATEDDSPYSRPSRTGVGQISSTSSRPHSSTMTGSGAELDLLQYFNTHGMEVDQMRSLSQEYNSLRRENKSLQERLSGHEQVIRFYCIPTVHMITWPLCQAELKSGWNKERRKNLIGGDGCKLWLVSNTIIS